MDHERFWKLLEPVHRMAASFCIKLAGDRDDGEDLYQDALLAALRRFNTLKDQSAFRPWFFQIVVNRYKNQCRAWWRRERTTLTSSIAESIGGENPADRHASRRMLKAVLAVLPAEDRALVVLREIEGWTVRELAVMFGKPEGTIKTRLFRAKARMRKSVLRHARRVNTNSSSLEVAYAVQRSKTVDERR